MALRATGLAAARACGAKRSMIAISGHSEVAGWVTIATPALS